MVGAGRLAEPETIVEATLETLGISQDLKGETVLVTAGPTYEPIDPVRGQPGYYLDTFVHKDSNYVAGGE